MLSFSASTTLDRNTAVLLPLLKDQLEEKQLRKLLTSLSRAQHDAVLGALKKGIPDSGVVPVYSTDSVILLLVLKEEKDMQTRDLRETGMLVSTTAEKYKLQKLAVLDGALPEKKAAALREGIVFGAYQYHGYKGKVHGEANKKKAKLQQVIFIGKISKEELQHLTVFQKALALTQDLINCPPKDANPSHMEAQVRKIAKDIKGVKAVVFREKELKKLGCNGILAVGEGSHEESRLLILEYKGGGKEKPIALVGKGVTYDTGGYSLKPSQYMESMKQDLGGAATVLGAFFAIASLKVKKNVIAVIPTVENSVNSYAYRPDDVIRMYNGVTVEVTNTDAEGRIILGDALSYSAEKYKPRAIVDLATLTGACSYAVGNDFAAVLGTDEKFTKKLIAAGDAVDEALWELPLHQRYKKDLESPIADIVNSSKMKAGTIEGGLFLQHFVPKDIPWCHLDIASVTFDDKKKAATGRNVRMLWELVKTV